MNFHSDASQHSNNLSVAQQKKLAKLLQQAPPSPSEKESFSEEVPLPLSSAQERLWFLEQLVPDLTAYLLPLMVRLVGGLEIAQVEQGLNELVRRHSALRTRFIAMDGRPYQIVTPPRQFSLSFIDLSSLRRPGQDRQLRIVIDRALSRPFDLTQAPLFRAIVLRQSTSEYKMLLIFHHIIADAWSLRIFLQDFSTIYAALTAGQFSSGPGFPVQTGIYPVWRLSRNEEMKAHLAYWQELLQGPLPVLQLPVDRKRPPIQTYRGAEYRQNVSASLLAQLGAYGRQEKATLYMVLLTAFAILLNRYTQETDLLVGTPIANRDRVGSERIIGFFANTLPIRIDLTGNPPFHTLLGRVREVTLAAFSHAALPFEKIVEIAQPERDMSYSPLFQAMFLFQNIAQPPLRAGNVLLEVEPIEEKVAQFDLTLAISHTHIRFLYNTDLFDSATIARMASHFESLLESIIKHPERPIAELSLLPESEREQVLITWNKTYHNYGPFLPVHGIFEQQAEYMPDALAVVSEAGYLTYRDLDRRANQMAHFLQALGVGPEIRVGLCLERSHDLMICLQAGGAYVPLDPMYPGERLSFMLKDAQAKVLITTKKLANQYFSCFPNVFCLDANAEALVHQPVTSPQSYIDGGNLAYVIYTSGSTGVPKGVQISHRAFANFLFAMQRQVGMTSHDRLLAITTLSFDIAGLELFLPLISGACTVIASQENVTNGRALARQLEQAGITFMQATPITWRIFVESGWEGKQDLTALCGGEALPEDLARLLRARTRTLWNMYGPTETTIWSTAEHMLDDDTRITIGHPIANTQAYILDALFQPLPCGVPGELYLGGDGVARGYLNRPDLTAEKFLPDPFASQPGARMYRTGDLARYLPDGRIECLGRLDSQVKLRGFRIELREISLTVEQYPGVRNCLVVVRADHAQDPRLIAYLVLHEPSTFKASPLRTFVGERLPEYMVPAAFVVIEAIPRLPNGKVDRQALLRIPVDAREKTAPDALPRTALEQSIATIWQEILHREQVSRRANFFDLGGHSLLMIRLHTRLERLTGQAIPLMELFQHPTIETLAGYLAAYQSSPTPGEDEHVKEIVQRQKQALRRIKRRRSNDGD